MTITTAKLDRDAFLVNQRHRAWMKSKYYVRRTLRDLPLREWNDSHALILARALDAR